MKQGYLRTGKILQLLGKEKQAIDIYKYGAANVAHDDQNIDVGETPVICPKYAKKL